MTNAELKAIVQREEYDFLRTNKHLGSNILFLTLSGSHAYGTNVEGSDIDIRGVAGSPEILGFNHFEQAIDNRTDTVIYAVNKFVGLLAQGNECMPDHIHLLVECSPQHFIPDMIKVLKGNSARAIFIANPDLKKQLWGGHLWNPSYFIATVSDNTRKQIQEYIASQKTRN